MSHPSPPRAAALDAEVLSDRALSHLGEVQKTMPTIGFKTYPTYIQRGGIGFLTGVGGEPPAGCGLAICAINSLALPLSKG